MDEVDFAILACTGGDRDAELLSTSVCCAELCGGRRVLSMGRPPRRDKDAH